MEGGSEPRSVPPFPLHQLHQLHPLHPAHPLKSSKFGIFDGKVVIFGLDGALA